MGWVSENLPTPPMGGSCQLGSEHHFGGPVENLDSGVSSDLRKSRSLPMYPG